MKNKKIFIFVGVMVLFAFLVVAIAPTIIIDAPMAIIPFQSLHENITFLANITGNLETCLFQYNGLNTSVGCGATPNFTVQSHTVPLTEVVVGNPSFNGEVIRVEPLDIWIGGFNKTGGDASTRGQVRNISNDNLSTCTFSGENCVFAQPIQLLNGSRYIIVSDGDGSAINRVRNNSGANATGSYEFPTDWFVWNATWTAGAESVADFWTINALNVTNINPIGNVTRNRNITISFNVTTVDNRTLVVFSNTTDGEITVETVVWNYHIFQNAREQNLSVYETKGQGYEINITYNSTQFTTITGNLIRGSTSNAGTRTGTSDNVMFTSNIQVPLVVGNGTDNNDTVNTFWSFTITNSSSTFNVNSTVRTQGVNPINLTIISDAPFNIPFINFTFQNETVLQERVNATITATWVYWLGDGKVNKTFTYTNNAENESWVFAFNPDVESVNVQLDLDYNNAESKQRRFTLY